MCVKIGEKASDNGAFEHKIEKNFMLVMNLSNNYFFKNNLFYFIKIDNRKII